MTGTSTCQLPGEERAYWCNTAVRLATPVLEALARRQLRATMPMKAVSGAQPEERAAYAHLEAFGRLLCGLAPWLELGEDDSSEGKTRAHLASLARLGIEAATDPASPDFMNFSEGKQPLVDTAFFVQALIRAPQALWRQLDARVQGLVIAAFKETRRVEPHGNNWILFGSEVEAFLRTTGETGNEQRLHAALLEYQNWYLGDGIYGDGPDFHWDYYNSFVIQPMLLDAANALADESGEFGDLLENIRRRLTRFAAIQERLIAPDGSFPAIGRSLAYRCGAFHALALAALEGCLPDAITAGQARRALTAVIRRTLEAPNTWDAEGWLTIGLAGHQPGLGERYISSGSPYLCSTAFLPLGLPPSHPFWKEPPAPTTWEKIWSGEDTPPDHHL